MRLRECKIGMKVRVKNKAKERSGSSMKYSEIVFII
jgi:hypothetical protein